MYRLDVFHPGSPIATETLNLERASDALQAIARLLEKHDDCEQIVVLHEGQRLFAVDCKGAMIAAG